MVTLLHVFSKVIHIMESLIELFLNTMHLWVVLTTMHLCLAPVFFPHHYAHFLLFFTTIHLSGFFSTFFVTNVCCVYVCLVSFDISHVDLCNTIQPMFDSSNSSLANMFETAVQGLARRVPPLWQTGSLILGLVLFIVICCHSVWQNYTSKMIVCSMSIHVLYTSFMPFEHLPQSYHCSSRFYSYPHSTEAAPPNPISFPHVLSSYTKVGLVSIIN